VVTISADEFAAVARGDKDAVTGSVLCDEVFLAERTVQPHLEMRGKIVELDKPFEEARP